MIIGGPFAFLAGLFSLGAAGLAQLSHDAQIRQKNELYAQHQAELKTHKYFPKELQQAIEWVPVWSRHPNRTRDPYGFKFSSLSYFYWQLYMSHSYRPYGVSADDIAGCALAKYYIEEIFHYEYCTEFARVEIPFYFDLNEWRETEELFNSFKSEETQKYLSWSWDEIIKDYRARIYYASYYAPYEEVAPYVDKGLINDIDMSAYKPLPPPPEGIQANGLFWSR